MSKNEMSFLENVDFLSKSCLEMERQTTVVDVRRSNQQGGLIEIRVALNNPGLTNGLRIETSGLRLYFSRLNSSPNANFQLEMTGGRTLSFFAPGACIEGSFDGFMLTRTTATEATSPAQGSGEAIFYVSQSPDLGYAEILGAEAVARQGELGIVIGQSVSATAGTVSGGANAPTVVGNGVPCHGMRGARVFIRNNSSNNILTGSVNWWFWNDFPALGSGTTNNTWHVYRNDPLPVSLNSPGHCAQIDFAGIRANRVYAELVNLSASAGTFRGDLYVI